MRLDLDFTVSELSVITSALVIKAEHHENLAKRGRSVVPETHRKIAAMARILNTRLTKVLRDLAE